MHHDDPTLQQCQALLQALYGTRLHGVVLYGSCARGTEEPESDIDLMVLLEGPVDGAQEIRRIWAVLYPLQLESDRLLSVLPVAMGRILSTLSDLRGVGAYGGAVHVSHAEANVALSEAQQFLEAVRSLLPIARQTLRGESRSARRMQDTRQRG